MKETAKKRHYVERKSTDKNPLIQRMIPVYDKNHDGLKTIAEKQNITLYKVYANASEDYLNKADEIEIPKIGRVNTDEELFLKKVLAAYRMRDKDVTYGDLVNVFESMLRIVSDCKS